MSVAGKLGGTEQGFRPKYADSEGGFIPPSLKSIILVCKTLRGEGFRGGTIMHHYYGQHGE